jgi:signal transduction histidine kinase
VDVTFSGAGKRRDLLIADNGLGMNRQELLRHFLRVSTDVKQRQPFSPEKKRSRAGRKGIGRFAAQRLARSLLLETETRNGIRLRLTIDWNKFKRDRNISAVKSKLEQLDPTGSQGTVLSLLDLRDEWTETDIESAYVYSADILEPTIVDAAAPEFSISIKNFAGGEVATVVDDPEPFRKYAAAEITGKVKSDGTATWSVESPTLALHISNTQLRDASKRQAIRVFPHLPELTFRALYFIKSADLIPGPIRKQVREYLSKRGGIRVYRNGFRVLPYGEQNDDWLSLDQISRTRVILYPLSNENWLGAVTISDLEGTFFQETSSREGLIRNDSFKELKEFLSASLVTAAQRVNERRGVKTLASQPIQRQQVRIRSEVRALKGDLRALANPKIYKAAHSENSRAARDASARLSKIERTYAAMARQFIQENALLRVLGSIGLTVGEFTHEVRFLLATIKAATNSLKTKARRPTEVLTIYKRLHGAISSLTGYVGYFDRLTSANYSREQRPIDVIKAVYEFRASAKPVLLRSEITMDVDIGAESAISVPMHESEWSAILLNFMTNSIKAIGRADRGNGVIAIRVSTTPQKMVRVDFEDSGDGIPQEFRERVFEAFFTTSTFKTNSDDFEQALGTGLGLKIVRDIVTAVGGRVYVAEPSEGFGTLIRVEVPEGV